MDEQWTLAELVGRAGRALTSADVRAPNARVTELPDARMIRWYATIGLVDRPSGFRGRTALYGPRHLLQLVAVKRLQARGQSLAQVQASLTGATEETLRRVAGLPDVVGPAPRTEAPRTQARRAEAPRAEAPGAEAPGAGEPQTGVPDRFWAARPALATPQSVGPQTVARQTVAPQTVAPKTPVPVRSQPVTLHGVSLPGGAMLLVPSAAVVDHVAAIRAAAAPLLAVLSAHGLLHPDEGEPA